MGFPRVVPVQWIVGDCATRTSGVQTPFLAPNGAHVRFRSRLEKLRVSRTPVLRTALRCTDTDFKGISPFGEGLTGSATVRRTGARPPSGGRGVSPLEELRSSHAPFGRTPHCPHPPLRYFHGPLYRDIPSLHSFCSRNLHQMVVWVKIVSGNATEQNGVPGITTIL